MEYLRNRLSSPRSKRVVLSHVLDDIFQCPLLLYI